jgi:Peptidase family M49
MIDQFLQSINLSPINTRLFKLSDTSFVIRVASVYASKEKLRQLGDYNYTYTENNNQTIKISVVAQDYSIILQKVNELLDKAKYYASNERE